ncbi:phage gp6-like head-tail connector protein [Pantoea sp. EKM20T]|uniref:phage gp6-like head-tail connector protein n=1 Tax=Pantoea sp. EKM20T TaxID=2708059 RepID=UPI00142D3A01|nr:phage gp6-like head-tail connector protein [Pantoea sp. EKM20T]KAF6685027.1 phage gp6-like head-tail connector protein [Pantoea sp. EKM20T]
MNERDMSLLKAVSEAVKEQLSAVQQRYETTLKEQAEEINRLKSQVEEYQQSVPDEQAIADLVLAKIYVPAAPALPDIAQMVKDEVAEIPVPESPVLPDIDGMIQRAVSAVVVPQPEPLPDIMQMVKDAVAEIPVPESPVLPDIDGMIQRAVSAIEMPQPEPLPDIAQMVKDAVAKIPKPEDGEPGEDGKDALQIEIMPHIDAEKSYPRGTYAIHHGGLWRSFQKTTGMNGWECLVDGISDIDITQAEDRQFTVTAVKSSGEKTEKTFSMPVMIYRDIFKDGVKYYPGDSVTWGGSVWYCHQETGDKPGEDGSKGWKLAVKRGRDARAK